MKYITSYNGKIRFRFFWRYEYERQTPNPFALIKKIFKIGPLYLYKVVYIEKKNGCEYNQEVLDYISKYA